MGTWHQALTLLDHSSTVSSLVSAGTVLRAFCKIKRLATT